ncbi:hypothetical protein PVAND_015579 [Polypedilum vanderplanki]|uniref:Fatty acyl-CoA reductase n=1 Tax=Polypedilum vanderplanki TaxID=319348 RepID=A0A9J6BDK3_POLVA|nr:hypothetical protein PVAND_015579 [Polypedilum vanderplanki]
MTNLPSIADFYANKSIFVTGGTGFIGKMIVEKLLRSCKDINTIYLLARPKKDKSSADRLQEMLNSPLFDKIREKNPEALNKIVLVNGDVAMENLGLSETDQKKLCDNVNVIIHSAATINFNEPLKVAIATNLQSVRELIKLARKVENLNVLVHVSTAYTKWYDFDVKEIFHKPNNDPNEVIEMCKTLSDEEINKRTKSLLGKHVNTYTYSKSLAEYLVSVEGKGLPIAIIRPSAVLSSVKEPFPGWIDNWAGHTLYVYMMARGLLRVFHMNGDYLCDCIPADHTVNITIAAGWKVGTDKSTKNKEPEIYQIATGSENPIKWKEMFDPLQYYARNYPLTDVLWYPTYKYRKSEKVARFETFVTQLIPAYIGDFAMKITGRKPRLVKTQKFIERNYNSVRFVVNEPIVFRTENYHKLAASMNENDLKEFDFDLRKIDWKKYIENYYFGARKYLWKQKDGNYPVLKKKVVRLKYANYVFMGTSIAASLYFLNSAKNLLFKKNQDC